MSMQTARLLIADDEANIRDVVQYALERDGYQVETAADGQTALARIEAGGIDLVVLDVLMPELDGLNLCRKLRELLGRVDGLSQMLDDQGRDDSRAPLHPEDHHGPHPDRRR